MNKIRLLLVEDDKDFSSSLNLRLSKKNFEVTIAVSAEDALDRLKNVGFDIIVADIKLPGIDGINFLTKVREINKDMPVILLTGYGSLNTAKEAVKLNATDYLLKPLESIDELLNPIYKAVYSYELLLENRRLTDNLQAKIEELEKSEGKLREQKVSLEQKNIALKEILEQIEIEKERIKDNILANVDKLVLPTLKKLRKKVTPPETKYVDMLQENLEELTSSFGRNIVDKAFVKLTPREIEICNMVKNGLTSKEIAEFLNISLQTAERHRNNIRKKLGLVKTSVNLTSYLQTL